MGVLIISLCALCMGLTGLFVGYGVYGQIENEYTSLAFIFSYDGFCYYDPFYEDLLEFNRIKIVIIVLAGAIVGGITGKILSWHALRSPMNQEWNSKRMKWFILGGIVPVALFILGIFGITQKKKRKQGRTLCISGVIVVLFYGGMFAYFEKNVTSQINLHREKRVITRCQIQALGTALGIFQLDFDRFPVSSTWKNIDSELLPLEYYEGAYKDAWGEPLQYASDGETYIIISYGADRVPGEGGMMYDADIVYVTGEFFNH